MQVFFEQFFEFLKGVVLFYTVQLGRSAMLSVFIILLIVFLRMTICKKTVFVKGLLWSLLIPLPFMGKMKFFYETEAGVRIFGWWQKLIFGKPGFAYLYIGIVLLLGIIVFVKRRKLWKYAKSLRKTQIEGNTVYVSDLEITPFVVGIIRSKIVLPEIMIKELDEKELKIIISHEKIHIKQGHLILYAIWDFIRILLWLNPMIFLCTKWFKEDLEDICDKVAIRKGNHDFYYYGRVLLHSIKCLKENTNTVHTLTFSGDNDYENTKRRITRVAEYKPYKQVVAWCMVGLVFLGIIGWMVGVNHVSYKRCSEMNVVSIYNMTDGKTVIEADKDILASAIYSDEDFIYIDVSVLDDAISLDKYRDKELFICTGGWYKIPGFGGGGEYVVVKGEELIGEECKIPHDMPEENIWVKMLKLL